MERTHIIFALLLTSLTAIILLLQGCTAKPQPAGIRFPIANGSHSLLPHEQQRILIWGDPAVMKVAETWLRSHHYSHIIVPSENVHPAVDREAAFTVAEELRAEFVLLLDREERKEGALIEPHCSAGFNITITVRGLLLASRESLFRGMAYYPHCVERIHEAVQNLTCQALATAWGFRPPGQLEIPSSLACTAGQIPLSTAH